jgi:hypothetical protein
LGFRAYLKAGSNGVLLLQEGILKKIIPCVERFNTYLLKKLSSQVCLLSLLTYRLLPEVTFRQQKLAKSILEGLI